MQAVVMAAGRGTRMGERTDERPKGMIPVGGEPLLKHLVRSLADAGIDEIVLVVGYRRRMIEQYFGGSVAGADLEYAVQSEPRGLADATLRAEVPVDGDFLSVAGDNLFSPGAIAPVLELHEQSEAAMATLVEEVSREQARQTAVLKFDDSSEIRGVVEKPATPPSRTVPAGFYVLPEAIFGACRRIEPSGRGEYEITDAVDLLLSEGARMAYADFDGERLNVNTPDDVRRAETFVATHG